MAYDVTIGIPVYNSADYLRRTLLSALAQTYSSIEFLVIDDASQDDSIWIVKELQGNHPRGKDIHMIVHAANCGVSKTRNDIINVAQGKYLFFMDSDDMISDITIGLMMQNVRQYNAEIVFGSYMKFEPSGNKCIYQYPYKTFLEKDELARFAYRKYAGIQASVCNYLVNTSLLRESNLRFVDACYWEDYVFTFDLVTLISRAVLLPDITYSYLCRADSLSHYQQRDHISKDEVMQNVRTVAHLKSTSSILSNKSYFPERCCNILLTDFFLACYVLRRRKDIVPYVSDYDIRSMFSHPATLMQLCKFRHTFIKNFFFYLLGVLPAFMSVSIIWIMGKLKKMI